MRKIFVLSLIALFCIGIIDSSLAAWSKEEADTSKMERIVPKKVEVDTNGDGKPDRVENYDKDGKITGVEADTNNDGNIDEWLYYEDGKLVKAAKDTSGDGKQDTWITY